ncbi:M42 family metallopeptidase [Dethiobacter alkaliphilus]|uniref:M42 family metallopeptidase n=1 Tax=Dethiobacter alkaliphilus TaxID=427926 RepID=UPI002225F8C0|nr:M42 family metallopeptidase [Dethiobacter alkaliphilus]MCW3489974.1 M42 family metallopeptidase [Dethiobacter alkaliphilus]
MKDLLKKLSETYGPAGREEQIARVIRDEIKDHVDEVYTDNMGNLYAVKKGYGTKVMIAAHMDEIGVIVTYIEEKGFLRFSNVGGLNPHVLLGQRLIFANGTVGTIGMEKLDDIKKLSLDKLYIDIGAKDREEAAKKVKIGDVATYHRNVEFADNRVIGKAMDNRAGCAVLIKAIQELGQTSNEIHAVFTAQEEVGLRGSRTSTYRINPDIGLAVDVTLTGDTPEAPKMDVSLGKGPTVKVKDASVICHPRLKDLLSGLAENNQIPYQYEVLLAGGTDAGAMHLTKEGIPSGVISVPCRYVHTPGEMVDLEDMQNAVKLLKLFLENPVEMDKIFPCTLD